MPPELQDQVHKLWDELSDFEASQSTQAAAHLMSGLCAMTQASNATWAGAIRVDAGLANDPLQGWRVAAVQALRPMEPAQNEGHFREILRIWERREIDPSFLLPLRGVGTFRTYSLRQGLSPDWFNTPFFHRYYGSVGTQDAAFVAFPLNADCESHFGFYASHPFSDEQIACLAYGMRGIKWFHRHLMLGNGLLMASSPLTPTEHKVMQLLLTKASEKEIGRQIGMATSTAHQHVTSIFRKFGVRSRAELMSLWLRPAG